MRKNKLIVFALFLFFITYNINAQNQSFLFVNSPEGLRIRDKPDISANVIGRLNNLEKVLVIEKDTNTVEIDEINDIWIKIKSSNLTGWVFGGYLEDSIDKIKNINRIAGMYYFCDYIELNKNNKVQDISNAISSNHYLDIKYIGNDLFKITFYANNDSTTEVDYSKISECKKNKQYFVQFGGDSVRSYLLQEFSFNTDDNLIYHLYL